MQIIHAYQYGKAPRPAWTQPLQIVNRMEPDTPDPDILYASAGDWIVATKFDTGIVRFCVMANDTYQTICGSRV